MRRISTPSIFRSVVSFICCWSKTSEEPCMARQKIT